MNDDFKNLKATLQWGSRLELTPLQRAELKNLCSKIAGRNFNSIVEAEGRVRR